MPANSRWDLIYKHIYIKVKHCIYIVPSIIRFADYPCTVVQLLISNDEGGK